MKPRSFIRLQPLQPFNNERLQIIELCFQRLKEENNVKNKLKISSNTIYWNLSPKRSPEESFGKVKID